jgi:hypothetical protein
MLFVYVIASIFEAATSNIIFGYNLVLMGPW